ncbi:MAG TPA: hypothetical protein V6C58_13505, partial [Allocoleopsis sp.]
MKITNKIITIMTAIATSLTMVTITYSQTQTTVINNQFNSWENAQLFYTVFKRHSQWVNTVAFSPDGQYLASGGQEGKILIWDINNK